MLLLRGTMQEHLRTVDSLIFFPNFLQTVTLKGTTVYHEMDLAFNDMYG
jgi:hypothetical protein